jgi:hypothetical protein
VSVVGLYSQRGNCAQRKAALITARQAKQQLVRLSVSHIVAAAAEVEPAAAALEGAAARECGAVATASQAQQQLGMLAVSCMVAAAAEEVSALAAALAGAVAGECGILMSSAAGWSSQLLQPQGVDNGAAGGGACPGGNDHGSSGSSRSCSQLRNTGAAAFCLSSYMSRGSHKLHMQRQQQRSMEGEQWLGLAWAVAARCSTANAA